MVALDDISLEIQSGEFVGVYRAQRVRKDDSLPRGSRFDGSAEGHLKIFDCACDELRCHHRPGSATCLRREWSIVTFPSRYWNRHDGRYGTLGLFAGHQEDRKIALTH